MVMNDTVIRPGGDAAVVRVHGTKKALAITTDCTPRYCYADPYEGGKQAVAESWRNLTCVGAKPLAITNCLNFGNPQKPEIMGQIVGCLEGMRDACLALDYPVISGNVSLYNETAVGKSISAVQPTPAIGGVGILADAERHVVNHFTAPDHHIILIGNTAGHLGSSLYLREVLGSEEGAPPPVDLTAESEHGNFVREIIRSGRTSACHDCSDGGLLIALAEMCFPQSIGAEVEFPDTLPAHAFAFGEDQARYLLAIPPEHTQAILEEASLHKIPARHLGKAGGDALIVQGLLNEKLAVLRALNESWLPDYMAG
jgi:phosphoribosylformylglycinamidine synthase